jgi:hypothetical protein
MSLCNKKKEKYVVLTVPYWWAWFLFWKTRQFDRGRFLTRWNKACHSSLSVPTPLTPPPQPPPPPRSPYTQKHNCVREKTLTHTFWPPGVTKISHNSRTYTV